jgi:hypothetical protein
MKEGGGGDHVSVGVTLPRTRGIRPISGKNLYRPGTGKKCVVLIVVLFLLFVWALFVVFFCVVDDVVSS